jgi:hypothetical protein
MELFRKNGDHELFNEWVRANVRTIMNRDEDSRLILDYSPTVARSANWNMTARVKDLTGSFSQLAKVEVSLSTPTGQNEVFSLPPGQGGYELRRVLDEAGEYSFKVRATLGADILQKEGRFEVSTQSWEDLKSGADTALLNEIARQTKGLSFAFASKEKWSEWLNEKDWPYTFESRTELKKLIEQREVFFILLLLLGTEWFTRRLQGEY